MEEGLVNWETSTKDIPHFQNTVFWVPKLDYKNPTLINVELDVFWFVGAFDQSENELCRLGFFWGEDETGGPYVVVVRAFTDYANSGFFGLKWDFQKLMIPRVN